jgi:glycerol-3-phosphate acyltransferase PlsY
MQLIQTSTAVLLVWAIAGYLLGSIPFGMVVARFMGLGNLREIGSGNIGATNVLRTGNKKAAALTLLFDAGKGAVIVLLARKFATEDAAQIAGLAAILGHCFPVWLKFKGGKGVATYFGLMIALSPVVGLAAGAIWLVVAAISRYSSLAALGTHCRSLYNRWANFRIGIGFGRSDLCAPCGQYRQATPWRRK